MIEVTIKVEQEASYLVEPEWFELDRDVRDESLWEHVQRLYTDPTAGDPGLAFEAVMDGDAKITVTNVATGDTARLTLDGKA